MRPGPTGYTAGYTAPRCAAPRGPGRREGAIAAALAGIALLLAGVEEAPGAERTLETPAAPARAVDFETDVLPILTRAGCNSGPCHGKASGQNGFRLSLLAFDPDFDHTAIAGDTLGRRISRAFPERSLLLLKATGTLPHGGGVRFARGSGAHDTIRRWIAAGAPRRTPGAPVLESISVSPSRLVLRPGESVPLRVTARYRPPPTAAGSAVTLAGVAGASGRIERDVTHLATYLSSEAPVVAVGENGLVRAGPLPGEATVMARFMGRIATCHASIPLPGEVAAEVYERLPRHSFIDDLVWRKLRSLGITPSPPASDATFLRRAYLDALGRLPSLEEARAFLDAPERDRRRLVHELLARPEFADFQANLWADLLRPNPYRVGIKAVFAFDAWIREAFRSGMPYDRFVRELVTARGSTFRNGAAVLFRDRRSPPEIATMVSQLFLGIRLECARCHHHPFEKWSQADFYRFAAFFARIGRKGTGLSPPISGGEEIIFAGENGTVRHPRTGEAMTPAPLFGELPDAGERRDPREALADWMLAPGNLAFRRVIVNRVWAQLMGRGLVEPVDDFRATNPPSNPELLDALAIAFRDHGHDLRWLVETIMTSAVYGLDSLPGERNVADTRNFSRHYRQRLRAEVLLDAICDITGVPEAFDAMPPGSRAIELWTHRSSSVFLDTFGRPDPNQDPPCTRTGETSVAQALHLMNSPRLHRKIADPKGRIAKLAASDRPIEAVIEELYLRVYSRYPAAAELSGLRRRFAARTGERRREEFLRDLAWALLNTPEFLFKN